VPILDEENRAINTENDEVIALLARSLRPEVVVQLIEAPGILDDTTPPGRLLPTLGREEIARREAKSSGRFRRKLIALGRMLDEGCRRVVVGDGRVPHPLRAALACEGTVIE
jgi:acetylglutamate kinase